MSRPSSRSRLLALAVFCSVVSLSVAAAWVLVPAPVPPGKAARALAVLESEDALDRLRQQVASFDPEASRLLASSLLARYEGGGSTDDMVEALLLMERDWSQPAWMRTSLVTQFVEHHCGHRLARWSWLCMGGD